MNWLRDPKNRVKASWGLFFFCLVAHPISSLTIFSEEPQGVLALSWAAIEITAINIIVTTDVRKKQDG